MKEKKNKKVKRGLKKKKKKCTEEPCVFDDIVFFNQMYNLKTVAEV